MNITEMRKEEKVMKKSKISALIAIMLVFATLLVSCGPDDQGIIGDSTNTGGSAVNNNYSASVGKWSEYLSYSGVDTLPIYTATEILEDLELDGALRGNEDLDILYGTLTETVEKTLEPTEPVDPDNPTEPETVAVANKVTTKWFDKTGKAVKTFVSITPTSAELQDDTIDELIDITAIAEYAISYSANGFIQVKTTTYQLKEVEAPEEDGAEVEPLPIDKYSSYEKVSSYTYYNADGTVFLDGLKSTLTKRGVNNQAASEAGYYLIDSEDLGKTFLMLDGKVAREFAYGEEYDVPVYDESSKALNGEGYAYFTVGDYKYIVTEEMPITTPIGELMLVLVPGMTVKVMNANDVTVASYSTECYGISGYAVLDNGNVYVCEYQLLNKDATEYDIISADEKLKVTHKLISVTDGSVTELQRSFVPSKLFNDNTKEIKSFTNLTTLGITDLTAESYSSLLDTAEVKDGFVLAEIQKYEGGNLTGESVYAVLDSNLEVVAELAPVIANQFTYPAFLDSDNMVVTARTVGNHLVHYAVNLKSGAITLAPQNFTKVQPLDGGYFWNYKVYDASWNVLKDFTEEDNFAYYDAEFQVINGSLYYYHINSSDSNYSHDGPFNVKRLSIVEKEGYDYDMNGNPHKGYTVEIEQVCSKGYMADSVALIGGLDSDGDTIYYNLEGEILFAESSGDEYVYSEKLGRDVRYTCQISVDTSFESDGAYIIVVEEEYEMQSSTFEDSGLEESFTEYHYYIIK